jgi:tetratricopeptide (TPR) repeat protein
LNDLQNAIISAETAQGLFESIGALDSVAVNTFKLAELYRAAGKHDQALKYLDRTLTLSRAAKKVRNEANALSEIAIVYASQKRPNEARNRLRKALEFYERIGDRRGQAIALNRYGQYLLSIGQNTEALDAYNQALPVS